MLSGSQPSLCGHRKKKWATLSINLSAPGVEAACLAGVFFTAEPPGKPPLGILPRCKIAGL